VYITIKGKHTLKLKCLYVDNVIVSQGTEVQGSVTSPEHFRNKNAK